MEIKKSEIEWSKRLAASVKVGGVWGVPRSGLIMRRTATGFELDSVMPFTPEMAAEANRGADVPPTAGKLLEYQESDFECMRLRFTAGGLTFTDPKCLLPR